MGWAEQLCAAQAAKDKLQADKDKLQAPVSLSRHHLPIGLRILSDGLGAGGGGALV